MNKQTKLNSNYLLYLFDFMYFDTLYSGTELFQGGCLISKNNAYFLRVEENGYFSVYASSHFHPLNRISSIDKEKQLNKGEPPYTLKLTHEGVIEINDSKNIEILKIIGEIGIGPYKLQLSLEGDVKLFDSKGEEVWGLKREIIKLKK